MCKKITYFFLIMISLLNLNIPVFSQAIIAFSDVKDTDWFNESVMTLTGMGVINGYEDGTFRPENNVTRGEFLKMLVSAMGVPLDEPRMGSDHWARKYARTAQTRSYLSWFPGGSDPFLAQLDQPITRWETAFITMNSFATDLQTKKQVQGFSRPDETKYEEYKKRIADLDASTYLYRPHVLWAYAEGILGGYEDFTFRPDNPVTRAEAAAIILRRLDETKRLKPDDVTKYINYGLSEEDIQRLRQYPDNLQAQDVYTTDGQIVPFYKNDEQYLASSGIGAVKRCMDIAKGYIEAVNNFNYTNYNEEEFWTVMQQYVHPQDFDKRFSEIVQWLVSNKITVQCSGFRTDSSMVYADKEGCLRVRGVLRYYVTSCADIEKVFGKGVKLNNWLEEDVEIALSSRQVGEWAYFYDHIVTISDQPKFQ